MHINHKHTSWLEIDLEAIGRNIEKIKQHSRSEIIAVLKGNAYGFGLQKICEYLFDCGVSYFAVNKPYEALIIKKQCPHSDVLLMGPVESYFKELAKADITFCVYSKEYAEELCNSEGFAGRPLKIHIKIDTGVYRLGFPHNENVIGFIKEINNNENLHLQGIYSTFSGIKDFDTKQLEIFNKLKSKVEKADIHNLQWHIASSANILNFPKSHIGCTRAGTILYGLYPSTKDRDLQILKLETAMSIHTKILSVKNIQPGEGVSHELAYKAEKKHKVALLALGMWDGFRGKKVILAGKKCPIIGTLSQNFSMVRIEDNMNVKAGDIATMLGQQDNEEITPQEFAEDSCLSECEVHANISDKLPRIYIQDEKT